MFTLQKTFRFEAGHVLTYHDGKCSKPHGHSYVLTVTIEGEELVADGPKRNMVIDFYDIKTPVKKLLEDYLDHHWLNDTLETDSPTCEYIAKWIFDYLKPKLPLLSAITVHETASSCVTYRS